jgi:hypothetical protein
MTFRRARRRERADMGFSSDQTYDAPVEAVLALFVDHDVVRGRYEAAGDRDIEFKTADRKGRARR